ncbi:hypothetical protein CHUAL_013515 [Chamberlinius hualienensis]
MFIACNAQSAQTSRMLKAVLQHAADAEDGNFSINEELKTTETIEIKSCFNCHSRPHVINEAFNLNS